MKICRVYAIGPESQTWVCGENLYELYACYFFFSSRRRHTRLQGDWSSDVCSSDLGCRRRPGRQHRAAHAGGPCRRRHQDPSAGTPGAEDHGPAVRPAAGRDRRRRGPGAEPGRPARPGHRRHSARPHGPARPQHRPGGRRHGRRGRCRGAPAGRRARRAHRPRAGSAGRAARQGLTSARPHKQKPKETHMTSKDPADWRLAEVWGDTVDLRHLAWAIAIGTGISVLGFYLASRWLVTVVESRQLAHAYAMLAGLAGCVIAGVICARAFAPKREVTELDTSNDPEWRREVLEELARQPGGLGTVQDLPPAVVQELKELKLYELFADKAGRA